MNGFWRLPFLSFPRRVAGALVDATYPQHCRACFTWIPEESSGCICAACLARLAVNDGPACLRCGRALAKYVEPERGCTFCRTEPHRFRRVVSALAYDDASRPLIHRFKYSGETLLAEPLAEMLAEAVVRAGLERQIDLIVPVPLHWARRVGRGYNQSDLLSEQLGRRLKIPWAGRLLKRTRYTPSQTWQSRAGRRRNMEGAFACIRQHRPASDPRRLLLVDDVLSTGSTASACADALRQAGYRNLHVAVVAR